jgi:site-specific DNA recombinase
MTKHRSHSNGTLRAMRENARQGYWNGSRPPFGYKIIVAEMRGTRTKKKIEPDPTQFETVRLIFRLARIGDGEGSMGVRQIAAYLNERGLRTQTGGRWGVGAVHDLLTRTTYFGVHRFNVSGQRKGTKKSPDDIVDVQVPAIIEKEDFDEVQMIMKSRAAQLKAPRFVNAPTLLGGVVFCADCGGAMTLRTSGKGKEYRYYTCCTAARQGKTGCRGRTIAMADLNELVVDHVERRLLEPSRLEEVLGALLQRRRANAGKEKDRIEELKRQAGDAEAKLTRLYEAIENGLAELNDPNLKGRIVELKRIRDAARADVERAEARDSKGAEITPETLVRFAGLAREGSRRDDGTFRRSHVQKIVQRAEVGADQIILRGSTLQLLETLVASRGKRGVETAGIEVHSFVPKWLPEQDSNLRPFD